MTPEKQRIAIAKAVPKLVEWHDGQPYWKGSWSQMPEGWEHMVLFDGLCDLNAIRAAEGTLNDEQCKRFARWLEVITSSAVSTDMIDRDGRTDYFQLFKVINATSFQRAEAFLRTIGKWKE